MFNPFDDYNWVAYILMVGLIAVGAFIWTVIRNWVDK